MHAANHCRDFEGAESRPQSDKRASVLSLLVRVSDDFLERSFGVPLARDLVEQTRRAGEEADDLSSAPVEALGVLLLLVDLLPLVLHAPLAHLEDERPALQTAWLMLHHSSNLFFCL